MQRKEKIDLKVLIMITKITKTSCFKKHTFLLDSAHWFHKLATGALES